MLSIYKPIIIYKDKPLAIFSSKIKDTYLDFLKETRKVGHIITCILFH